MINIANIKKWLDENSFATICLENTPFDVPMNVDEWINLNHAFDYLQKEDRSKYYVFADMMRNKLKPVAKILANMDSSGEEFYF